MICATHRNHPRQKEKDTDQPKEAALNSSIQLPYNWWGSWLIPTHWKGPVNTKSIYGTFYPNQGEQSRKVPPHMNVFGEDGK